MLMDGCSPLGRYGAPEITCRNALLAKKPFQKGEQDRRLGRSKFDLIVYFGNLSGFKAIKLEPIGPGVLGVGYG
jgi:hypothetical protein